MGVVDRSNHSLPWHQKQDLDFFVASSYRYGPCVGVRDQGEHCVCVLEELLVEDNAMCSCRQQVCAAWIFALVNEASQCGFLRWSTKRRSSQGKNGCLLGTLVLVVVVCVRGATREMFPKAGLVLRYCKCTREAEQLDG